MCYKRWQWISNIIQKYLSRLLVLKAEHSGNQVLFLYVDIKIEDCIFVCKLFGKRDKFPFFIFWNLHFSSNIPSIIFYGSIFSELLQIARYTLRVHNFIPRESDLISEMVAQGKNWVTLTKQLKQPFHHYQKFVKTHVEINMKT